MASADSREFIRIRQLAHGFQIEIVAAHPNGPARQLEPVHYPTRELAEKFAEMMHAATGVKIIRSDEESRK